MFKENNNHFQNSLFDTTQWMNSSVKKKYESSWAPIFYEHVFKKIDEKPFAVLFSDIGRSNFPINYLLSLEYLKHMLVFNDEELIEGFYFNYLVSSSLGIKVLGEVNLAARTLYYFRERIYSYLAEHPEEEDPLFGQFISLLENFSKEASIKLDLQRTDTTMFKSNIKKAGRLSLAYDVLRLAVNSIPEDKLTDSLKATMEASFKKDLLYLTKSDQTETKLTKVLNLCGEAQDILSKEQGTEGADSLRIISRFLNEQSISDADQEKLIPISKDKITSDSLQSAYDEDATYRTKGSVKQSGYVLELSETCSKENPFQLITDYETAPNNKSDIELLTDRLGNIKENTGCSDMYVDGGFHSNEVSTEAGKNSINIHLTDMSGKKPYKKLPITAFEIDPKEFILIRCPAGHSGYNKSVRDSQSVMHLPLDTCRGCDMFNMCHSKIQKKDCVVRVQVNAIKSAFTRQQIEKEQKENTSMRAAIEGTNSSIKRTGLNHMQVRGLIKVSVAAGLMCMAQNIKRFIRFKQGGYEPRKPRMRRQGIIAPSFG